MLCSGRGGLRFCKIRSRIGLLQDRPSHSFAWTSGWWPVALLCLKQGLLVHSTCSSWDLWNNAVRCFTSQFFPSSSWGLSHVDLTDGNSKSFSYRPMISTKSWLFFFSQFCNAGVPVCALTLLTLHEPPLSLCSCGGSLHPISHSRATMEYPPPSAFIITVSFWRFFFQPSLFQKITLSQLFRKGFAPVGNINRLLWGPTTNFSTHIICLCMVIKLHNISCDASLLN